MSSLDNQPAILGGTPIVPTGLPAWPISDEAIQTVFLELHASGAWGQYHGDYSQRLTESLSTAYHSQHVMLTSSGTSAVELALRGVNVVPGDEVILAAYDYKANFTNATLLGAMPVLVDIQSNDGQVDVDQLQRALSPKTKAVIASHLHGGLVEIQRLKQLTEEHNLCLIEDCCQVSPQATIQNTTAGCCGDVSVLSFGGSKLLSAGRGGAVISHRDDIAQRIKLYQERGNTAYPFSEIQAAVLIPQLEALPARHAARQAFVEPLKTLLNEGSGVQTFSTQTDSQADYYKLGMWYNASRFNGLSRETFCKAMRAEGIPLDPGFASLHRIHAKRRFRQSGELSIADVAHDSIIILHHPFMLDGADAAQQFLQGLDRIKEHATILQTTFDSK